MNFSRPFILRPIATSLLMVALLVAGMPSGSRLSALSSADCTSCSATPRSLSSANCSVMTETPAPLAEDICLRPEIWPR